MTIDEALAAASRSKQCWITWNANTGEIISVTGFEDSTPTSATQCLMSLEDTPVPTRARFFDSGKLSREILEAEQRDCYRVNGRVEILRSWAGASADELIAILERDQYAYPMDRTDSKIIVEHLWELHRDELTGDLLDRLKHIAGETLHDLRQEVLADKRWDSVPYNALTIYVTALEGDKAGLKAIWSGERPGRDRFMDTVALIDAFGHVQIEDRVIIDEIIQFVANQGPFDCHVLAMLTLGRLGPVAGADAIGTIKSSIRNCEPNIIVIRDRVCERLEDPHQLWRPCGHCCHGNVHPLGGGHGVEWCAFCLGLGYRRA